MWWGESGIYLTVFTFNKIQKHTFGQEASLYETGLDQEPGQEQAEGRDDVQEGPGGARVPPEAPRTTAAEAHGAGGLRRAGAETATQLEAVVGEVADPEDGGEEEDGEQQHGDARQHDVGVQLETGRGGGRPCQVQVL